MGYGDWWLGAEVCKHLVCPTVKRTEGSSGAVESPVPLTGPQPTQQWKTTAA